jgi:antitoxin component YwqK of YwqJK toxin-antitoxin module
MQQKLYFLLGISLFLLVFVVKKSNPMISTKTAKNVPLVFVRNYELVMVQDTAYYKNQKFSGIEILRYSNGDTALIKPYFEGLEEGWIKKWHPNKVLAEKRFYLAGRKEGLHEAWWLNGKRKFSYQFDNDEFNGLVKEWYEHGGLFKEFHYKNGHEEGSQKLYWENGKARANYLIKNNRRYGLLGTKNCINVADSIPFRR